MFAMELRPLPMTDGARKTLIAISALWVVFAVVVILRVLGRFRGVGMGADDVLSMVALVLSGSTIGLNVAVFSNGVGYNFDPASDMFSKLTNNLPFIMQITFAFTLIYIWCLAALKMSQLALYMRVFSLQLRNWVYGIGAIVLTWAICFNFVFIFLCDPIPQQWTMDRIGKCVDQILVLKCLIITNLVTDLMIFLLPIRAVWQLQMRKTEKFAVLACFGLGLACCVISLARFIQIYTIDLIGNLTGTSLTTFMLCTVELMLAGLCINIPLLRPFYKRWRAKYKSSSDGSGGHESGKVSLRKGHLVPPQARQDNYMAWIELDDKERTMITQHDAGSETKLTSEAPDVAIHVSRDWAITRV
ncbi:hypothetical protein P153DRAFT_419727 [Dothidotthia symphoricarpi CBS 119687]|uniref:Rhodopsin domain-containing protein n=1 Tax=Dothidotthia symphoricarpi CBS 119687 TaxID=1392245 RepID=A0A6A6ASR4_9PLEO|nr:uncharacterized protein P153DRAFT_419727 [Dothidotthia symphoricarpi CBS 119687]KAF2133897.1 hypothetical protein P153DRAFT_419727 [Dothidotthia symphoricarpi CBS 119687]